MIVWLALRSSLRLLIGGALIIGLVGGSAFVMPSAATEISIVGDDEIDAYRGTGGLLLGSSFSGSKSQRMKVAQCLTCVWRYVNYCRTSGDPDATCTHSIVTCPRGKLRYRVKFSNDGALFKTIGSICQGAKQPTTRRDVEQALASSSLHKLPALAPRVQPQTTLTIVPVAVSTGQPRDFIARARFVGDAKVILRASVTWRWEWGDGTRTSTRLVSTLDPTTETSRIAHQYRAAGTYQIRVRSTWKGQFEVVGLGTFAVPGTITQDAVVPIQVLRAHSVLLSSADVR